MSEDSEDSEDRECLSCGEPESSHVLFIAGPKGVELSKLCPDQLENIDTFEYEEEV